MTETLTAQPPVAEPIEKLTSKLISKIYDYLDKDGLTAEDYRTICSSLTILRDDQERLLKGLHTYLTKAFPPVTSPSTFFDHTSGQDSFVTCSGGVDNNE